MTPEWRPEPGSGLRQTDRARVTVGLQGGVEMLVMVIVLPSGKPTNSYCIENGHS